MAENPATTTGAAEYRRAYLAELSELAESTGPPERADAPVALSAALGTLRDPDVDATRRDAALAALVIARKPEQARCWENGR